MVIILGSFFFLCVLGSALPAYQIQHFFFNVSLGRILPLLCSRRSRSSSFQAGKGRRGYSEIVDEAVCMS